MGEKKREWRGLEFVAEGVEDVVLDTFISSVSHTHTHSLTLSFSFSACNPHRPEDESVRFLTSSVVNEMCMEKRVFYRIVSALHATINLHVAAHYPLPSPPAYLSLSASLAPAAPLWRANATLFARFFSPESTFGEGPQWLKMYILLLL